MVTKILKYLAAIPFLLASFSTTADEPLWKAVQEKADMVVVMRHAHAHGGDSMKWDESGNCREERMLSDEGKSFAKKIGDEFRARNIKPVAISSPLCRCRDTATLAFGSVVSDPALRAITNYSREQTTAFQDKTRELLLRHRGRSPVAYVSHQPNIETLTGEKIETGELVIGRIRDDGGIDVIGKIRIAP